MRQIVGWSPSGDIKEALKNIDAKPSLLILYSDKEHFETNVQQLDQLFPGVPSIAAPVVFYSRSFSEGGLGVCALYGVNAVTGVMRNVSTAPVTDIGELKRNCNAVSAGIDDTVCITMCTGNDACVLATIYGVMRHHGIHLTGGTVRAGLPVAVNGKVYYDAAAYALVKNLGGRVKVYKENLYRPVGDQRYIASRTDPSKYYIGELNGRPAKLVYKELLHIVDDAEVSQRTLRNPFGRIVGKDIFIVSISGVLGDGLTCYRQVSDSDVLTLLELKDIKTIVQQTVDKIHNDMPSVSGILSVNCVFRQQLFENNGYLQDYLDEMSFAPHCGFFGYGEHYNGQFVNQSMSCAVFE
ncbi:MAG: FIST C-terminal domain-containing protein [Oscillospiraceae bacterium]|nr:FIST C-terminal domain-containing protein [Oscillospiraceae bacterium]